MNIAKSALTAALSVVSVSTLRVAAFSPAFSHSYFPPVTSRVLVRKVATTASSRTTVATTALKANVLKLTEPSKDLLPHVDVFIFDCDGVIWRVSTCIYLLWKDGNIFWRADQSIAFYVALFAP